MEIYLTIEGLAEYLKLAEQTIRRWVLNREIPFQRINTKLIRFRVSEIEKWIDEGGVFKQKQNNVSSQEKISESILFDDGTQESDGN